MPLRQLRGTLVSTLYPFAVECRSARDVWQNRGCSGTVGSCSLSETEDGKKSATAAPAIMDIVDKRLLTCPRCMPSELLRGQSTVNILGGGLATIILGINRARQGRPSSSIAAGLSAIQPVFQEWADRGAPSSVNPQSGCGSIPAGGLIA